MGVLTQNFSTFKEDVSTLGVGSTIISQPCRVYEITFSTEGAGDSIISFSNSEEYDTSKRYGKVVLTDEKKTHTITYPTGKYFSTGLSATSNLAGVDVAVTYE